MEALGNIDDLGTYTKARGASANGGDRSVISERHEVPRGVVVLDERLALRDHVTCGTSIGDCPGDALEMLGND